MSNLGSTLFQGHHFLPPGELCFGASLFSAFLLGVDVARPQGGHPSDDIHQQGQVGEGRRQEGVRVKELDCQVESPVLPLGLQVVVDLPVGDRQHDNEYPEEDDTD